MNYVCIAYLDVVEPKLFYLVAYTVQVSPIGYGPHLIAHTYLLKLTVVLEPLRRLWCKITMQSTLVLESQTIDSQAHIGKNRGSRLSKSKGSGHLLVQVFHKKKKGMH